MTSQIAVNHALCRSDGACVAVCPSRRLFLNDKGFPEELPDAACILCGHCVAVCPNGAITHHGLPQESFLPATRQLPEPVLMDGFLNSRRSVREFKDEPVPRQTLEELLDVARRAPTASNSQRLAWLVVEEKAKVHALSAETMRWVGMSHASPAQMRQWKSGYDIVLRGAPALVVALAPEDYPWGKEDCAIALTFLELAAEARGLGICWAGFLTRAAAEHAPLRKLLHVPEGYAMRGGLMIGKPTYAYRLVPPREPLKVQWV